MPNRSLNALLLLAIVLTGHFSARPSAPARQDTKPSIQGQIAYVGPDMNIWLLREGNEVPYPITQDAGKTSDGKVEYFSPRYSPDGSVLAFCKVTTTQGVPTTILYIARAGEWQPIELAEGVYCKSWPQGAFDWSPDGLQITYALNNKQSGATGIWSINILSGESQQIIAPPGRNSLVFPQWSADGQWIKLYENAFIEGLGALRTWNTQTGQLVNYLSKSGDVWPAYSSWSPDGKWLAFDQVTYTGFSGAGLFYTIPNADYFQPLFSAAGQVARLPVWAPDASFLVFQLTEYSDRPTPARLARVNYQGGNLQELYKSEGLTVPLTWSPDKKQLLFSAGNPGAIDLMLYDFTTNTATPLADAGDWGADWSAAPALLPEEADLSPQTVDDFPLTGSLLAYTAGDYRLTLFDPATGKRHDLTGPLSVARFWASPSGRRLIYNRRLLDLKFQEDGRLVVGQISLPAAPAGQAMLNWSGDESRLAFQDTAGNYWIVNGDGAAVQIADAAGLPAWSFDGSWLAYCSQDGGLWVLGPDFPASEIARSPRCDYRWSPSQNLLAYTAGDGPAKLYEVQVFDAAQKEARLLLDDAVLDSWSPDGRLLAAIQAPPGAASPLPTSAELTQIITASLSLTASLPVSPTNPLTPTNPAAPEVTGAPEKPGTPVKETILIVDPVEKQVIQGGMLAEDQLGLRGWTQLQDGYLYGPQYIASDLSETSRIADAVLSASADGSRLLAVSEELGLLVLSCFDLASGQNQRLLTVDLDGLSESGLPGVWGWMASDGSQAITRSYIEGNFANLLYACQPEQTGSAGSSKNLPWSDLPQAPAFSPDNRYFLPQASAAPGGYLLYDLQVDSTETLSGVSGSNIAWIQPPRQVSAVTYAIAGQILDDDGQPLPDVSIYIDDILATTTDKSGGFSLTRLPAGEYTVGARHPDYTFTPTERELKLPPNKKEVNFKAAKSKTGSMAVNLPTPTPQEGLNLRLPVLGWAIPDEWLPYLIGGLVGLVLLAWLTIKLMRRASKRRASAKPPAAAPAQPPGVTPAAVEAGGPPAEKPASLPGAVAATAAVQAVEAAPPAPEPAAEITPVPEPPVGIAPAPAALAPAEIDSLVKAGIAAVRAGDLSTGQDMLRRAVQYRPDDPDVWLWLGWVAARTGEGRAAERCFRRAEKLGHPNAKQALEWLKK